ERPRPNAARSEQRVGRSLLLAGQTRTRPLTATTTARSGTYSPIILQQSFFLAWPLPCLVVAGTMAIGSHRGKTRT
ncbi:hypothetical protein, partial [Enterococcus faecium]